MKGEENQPHFAIWLGRVEVKECGSDCICLYLLDKSFLLYILHSARGSAPLYTHNYVELNTGGFWSHEERKSEAIHMEA